MRTRLPRLLPSPVMGQGRVGMAVGTALAFWLIVQPAALAWADLASQSRTYLYRPEVFADRLLGVGVPADRTPLASYVWYLRMDESVRALAGMDTLGRFVRTAQIPGLDFTGHRTLTTGDVEQLFRIDQWTTVSPTFKFRLLKLFGTQVDNRAMPTIGRLFDLLALELGDRVDDQGLRFLSNLRQLRVLALSGDGITDAGVKGLAMLTRLERLSLTGRGVTDAGLPSLKGLPLRQLDLGSGITDAGLKTLSAIHSLEHLDLSRANVSEKGLRQLKALSLHTLFLGPSVGDPALAAISSIASLKRLDLTGARVTDAGVQALASLRSLEELSLSGTSVSPAALAVLARLPRLRYLEVSQTRIDAASLAAAKGWDSLQVLSITSTRRLSRREVEPLARLKNLHTLLINGVPLGRAHLENLRQSRPRARIRLLEWLIPEAVAEPASDAEVEQALEVASLTDRTPSRPFRGFQGLKMIHEAESSLDEVIPSVASNPAKVDEMTEENFLGEFTVEAGRVKVTK